MKVSEYLFQKIMKKVHIIFSDKNKNLVGDNDRLKDFDETEHHL